MPAPIADVSRHNKAHLGIRLRDEEKKLIEAKASAAGKPVGEWAREVLLSTVHFSPDYRALMAEFLAMRAVVLTMSSELAQGRPVTTDKVKETMEHAESQKFLMADRRIAKYV